MTDIRNLQAFALYMQKTDIKFDLYSVTREMETQVRASPVIIFLVTYVYPLSCLVFVVTPCFNC